MRATGVRLACLLALVACGRAHDAPATAPALGSADAPALEEIAVPATLPPGMSDLALGDRGQLWAIPERDHVVYELTLTAAGVTAASHPLDGVPDATDTEALAWLGDGRFVIGTEGQDDPTASLMFGALTPEGHIALTSTVTLTSAEVGVELARNHGVEGVCGTHDTVVAAIETVGTLADGSRFAPIVRLQGDRIVGVSQLRLTSDKGKISALFCTFAPDGSAQVLAIERHYGISRILAFAVPVTPTEITPTLALDLWPLVRERYAGKLNLEGIVRTGDGRWVLINDNQGKYVDGATHLFVIHPR